MLPGFHLPDRIEIRPSLRVGVGSGVKELLTRKLPGVKGIVADLVGVTDESAIALVEKVLGSMVQTVVFDTEENLINAMRLLKSAAELRVAPACNTTLTPGTLRG